MCILYLASQRIPRLKSDTWFWAQKGVLPCATTEHCPERGKHTWVVCTVYDAREHRGPEEPICIQNPRFSPFLAVTLFIAGAAYTRSEHSFCFFATMRAFFHSFVLIARLSMGVFAIPSDDHVAIRAEDAGDNLDEWLAAAQRVSTEALKACPSSCSTASNKNRRFTSKH